MIKGILFSAFNLLLLLSMMGCDQVDSEDDKGIGYYEVEGEAGELLENSSSTSNTTEITVVETPPLFREKVYDDLSSSCISCHTDGKIAGESHLVFLSNSQRAIDDQVIAKNYAILHGYTRSNSEKLLNKVLNRVPHVGGNVYGSSGSNKFKNLEELVDVMLTTDLVPVVITVDTPDSTQPDTTPTVSSTSSDNTIVKSSSSTSSSSSSSIQSNDDEEVSNSLPALFTNTIYPQLSASCLNCHVDGSIAASTPLVFKSGENRENENYKVLSDYVQGNAQKLLDKVINKETHVGGNLYGSTDNAKYINLRAMITIMSPDFVEITASSSESSSSEDTSDVPTLFAQSIYPDFKSSCIVCHAPTHVAGATGLVFEKGENKTSENYAIFENYAKASAQTMLNKVLAVGGHGGGNLYGSESNAKFINLRSMLETIAPNALSSSSKSSSSSESSSENNASSQSSNTSQSSNSSDSSSQSSVSSASSVSSDSSSSDANTDLPTLFVENVYPDIKANCTLCHATGLVAGSTGLVFLKGANKSIQNYAILRNYASTSSEKLLNKVLGKGGHGGGNQYGSINTPQYINLKALIAIMNDSEIDDPEPEPENSSYYSDITYLSNYEVLRKAAILFAGRVPTTQEITLVKNGDDSTLKTVLRDLMQGEGFSSFVYETADTHFLTSKTGQNYSRDYYPALEEATDIYGGSVYSYSTSNETLELLKYIVLNDRSYKEIITADYTMVNPFLNVAFKTGLTFNDNNDKNEWKPASITSNEKRDSVSHAGVLTMASWLRRFPTTSTNRNRHRSKIFFKQFLGVDIESLAQRALDDTGVFHNPSMQNPNCVVCHETMDPVAGAFQNWGESNRYRRNSNFTTALPGSYMSNRYPKDENEEKYYQKGDIWFRDVLKPGFNGEEMEGGYLGNKTSLQWLATKAVEDDRFAIGAVKFWYQSLFGMKPLESPFDETDPTYENALAAFNAQNELFTTLATKFRADSGHGDHNVKDLLINLVMSDYFRAKNIEGGVVSGNVKYAEVGMSRLLTPEQLQRKLINVTGKDWNEFRRYDRSYALSYGGFDTTGLTDRNTKLTMMMGLIVERMAFELSCTIVADDFKKESNERILFPEIDLLDTEVDEEVAIRENLVTLHQRFLGTQESIYSREINATYELFSNVRADRDTPDTGKGDNCRYTIRNDDNYSGRSWAAVVNYLLTDPYFIYE